MLEFSYVNFHFHLEPLIQYFMTLCKINSERLLPKERGCILNWNTSLCLATCNFFPSTVLLGGLEIPETPWGNCGQHAALFSKVITDGLSAWRSWRMPGNKSSKLPWDTTLASFAWGINAVCLTLCFQAQRANLLPTKIAKGEYVLAFWLWALMAAFKLGLADRGGRAFYEPIGRSVSSGVLHSMFTAGSTHQAGMKETGSRGAT